MQPNKSLKEKDKKFRLLFEENPQPMWVFDSGNLRIIDANAAASLLYGFSAAEFRGLTLADILGTQEAPRFGEWLRQSDRGSVSSWRHVTKSGRLIDVEMAVHEIDYGAQRAQLAILIDITGRRELEDQLRQAQKMEAVGLLAGGVAHDFNNLLTIITGYSQLILNTLSSHDPNRHSAEQILKAGERAAALTRQLLAFSRRQVLQPRVLDLNRLVSSLSIMLQRLIGEDIDLRLELGADLGRVSADPSQIEQVLMNLVVNARDAMPRGGSLTIETGNVALDTAYSSRHMAARPGPYVLLSVSDNGAGMDEATQARLFEPFFTTKGAGRGTGLGLSTVFGIVKQSGGTLDVSSEPGRGSSFRVYLPRIDQPATADDERPKARAHRGSETILLVEDDDMVRNLVRQTLEHHGFRVLDSSGPTEARRMAANHRGPIQLMVTDVVMPRISGRELAEQMLIERPAMKVLYMSGYTDNAVGNTGILKKEVAFLQKPFTPEALIDKVREVLESGKICKAGE